MQEIFAQRTYILLLIEVHGDFEEKQNKIYINRVVEILQESAKKIFDYFDYKPTTNISIVIESEYTRANGAATVFPRNIIYLYTQPPVGSEHLVNLDDWLKGLVLHELIHIAHMDKTKGLLQVVRTFFGSIGKLGGVVPRWFSEGLATWGENYFTEGGRLTNNLFVTETFSRLMDESFCDNISCLDNPLSYPYGQYPYWIGAQFLKHIEDEKPGALKCIVDFNSSQIPFFLNIAFDRCTGRTATAGFKVWRELIREELLAKQKAFQESSVVKKNLKLVPAKKEGLVDVFQKDFQVKNGKLFTVEAGDRIERLVIHDLKDESRDVVKIAPNIDRIVSVSEKSVLLNTSTYQRAKTHKQSTLYHLSEKKESDFSEIKGDYPFETSDGKKFNIVFHKGQWSIVNKNLKEKKEKKEKEDPLFRLPYYVEIQKAQVLKIREREYLGVMISGDGLKKSWHYWLIPYVDGSFKAAKSFLTFDRPTGFLESCENNFLFHQKDKILVGKYTGLDQARVKTVSGSWIAGISAVRWDDNHTVVYMKQDPQNLYVLNHGCREVIREFVEEARTTKTSTVKTVVDPQRKTNINTENVNVESYPSARHYLPHYWTFGYVGGENLNTWSATTGINDPLDKDSLTFTLKYFPDFSEVSPTGSYIHEFGWFKSMVYFDRSFIKSSLRPNPDENEIYGLGLIKEFEYGFFNLQTVLGAGKKKITDFVSQRDLREVYLHNKIVLPKLKYESFFQGATIVADANFQDVEYSDRFMGYEYSLSPHFRLFDRTLLHTKGTYGKLVKNGISDGVLYGGGSTDYDFSTLHSFIGLDANDAFGNEIITYNLELDYELSTVGWAWGLSPFYLKRIHLIAGQDFIKTDFIFNGYGFKVNSDLTSHYVGLRTSWNIGYMLPLDLDIIRYKLDDSSYRDDEGTTVIIKGSFEI